MRQKTALLALMVCAVGLYAEESDEAIKTESKLTFTASSIPEAKIGFTHTWTIPFLQWESFLTRDNNLSAALGAELSPISVNGTAEIVWTPIAFFQFVTGGRIGTGWNITLFGNDITGIGVNKRKPDDSAEVDAAPGLLWSVKAGGVLRFDLAAVIQGEWNHIVFRTYHEINYAGYSAADAESAWYFENDDGENQNGFSYYGNFLMGWQPPIFLNTIALLAEQSAYLYNAPDPKKWGGDMMRWSFSLLLNFTVTKRVSIAALCQFRTRRNYIESGWKDLHYQNRTLDTSDPLHLEFYRAAAVVSVSLF